MPSVVVFVAVLAAIQATGRPSVQALASSPARLADGEVWVLLTSGLRIDGAPWLQLAVLAAVLVLSVRRLGALRTWVVALAAHVGAALVAYAGVGLLWLGDRSLVAGTVHQADYGVSVLLAGLAGALTVTAGSRRAAGLTAAVAGAAFVATLWTSSALAGAEHLLGFVLGALAVPRSAGVGGPVALRRALAEHGHPG